MCKKFWWGNDVCSAPSVIISSSNGLCSMVTASNLHHNPKPFQFDALLSYPEKKSSKQNQNRETDLALCLDLGRMVGSAAGFAFHASLISTCTRHRNQQTTRPHRSYLMSISLRAIKCGWILGAYHQSGDVVCEHKCRLTM